MIMTAYNGLCSRHLREMWKSIRNIEGCQRSELEFIEKDEIEFFFLGEHLIAYETNDNRAANGELWGFFSMFFARLVGCHDTVIQF